MRSSCSCRRVNRLDDEDGVGVTFFQSRARLYPAPPPSATWTSVVLSPWVARHVRRGSGSWRAPISTARVGRRELDQSQNTLCYCMCRFGNNELCSSAFCRPRSKTAARCADNHRVARTAAIETTANSEYELQSCGIRSMTGSAPSCLVSSVSYTRLKCTSKCVEKRK